MSVIAPGTLQCFHCGEDCPDEPVVFEAHPFCCQGCKTVYEILAQKNLCTYYDLTEKPGKTFSQPVYAPRYAYLLQPDVQEKLIQYKDETTAYITFFIPSMHCSSCIWLLEHLYRLHNGIVKSSVDFLKKEIRLAYNESAINLQEVVVLLARIGYEPYISLQDADTGVQQKASRSATYKIGIAGFCFGNIMMLSFPDYFAGGDLLDTPQLATIFRYLSLLLSIPVITYCAAEFFTGSVTYLKQKRLNIDFPIALALIITFGRSLYEIISGTGSGYLDSMTGIVFFMLLGRWAQSRTLGYLSFTRDYKSYFPVSACVIRKGTEAYIPVHELQVGDDVLIRNNELIPSDAVLLEGEAEIDYSFVTGESEWVEKHPGDMLYAGGRQKGAAIRLKLSKPVAQSYLTSLWNNEAFQQPQQTRFDYAAFINKYFSAAVLVISIAAFAFWMIRGQHATAWNSITTVLIVACPCALLLGATFTSGNMLSVFSANGFYLRNASVIETLGAADTIVFDKTGTLTRSGKLTTTFIGADLSGAELTAIRSVATHSMHPLSRSIDYALHTSPANEVKHFEETAAMGISAVVAGIKVKMGSPVFVEALPVKAHTDTRVYVSLNGEVKGYFTFENTYRNGLQKLIGRLSARFGLHLVSGDNENQQTFLAQQFPTGSDLRFNQSPEDKLHFIRHLQQQKHTVVMIGDGLNDAGALRQSDAGIAITEDVNNFSPACDVIMSSGQFEQLPRLLQYAALHKWFVGGSFALSLVYNVIGLYFALQGQLKPVIAAILMPASSLSIILFTWAATHIAARTKAL